LAMIGSSRSATEACSSRLLSPVGRAWAVSLESERTMPRTTSH
jgi:hypothetical protein